jgi:mediator of replication checkpoint protein 1
MLGASPSSHPVQSTRNAAEESEDDLYTVTPRKQLEHMNSTGAVPGDDQPSNGLFVSPAKSIDHGSEDEMPSNPFGTKEKLQSLIAQKRAERLAREADERKRRNASSSDLPDEVFENSQGDPIDPNVEKILSDASKPARKASKKALLEMERETQRMARQQALAHQMRVKKKFTTNDLLAKFNFRRDTTEQETSLQTTTDGDTTASSAPNSDGPEAGSKHPVSTPPSSPPTPLDQQKTLVEQGALSKLVPVREDSLASLAEIDDDEELPYIAEVVKSSQLPKAVADGRVERLQPEKKGLKLARLGKKAANPKDDGSDDELEILSAFPSHLQAFEKAMRSYRPGRPADSKAIHALKHLSHFNRDVVAPKKGSRRSTDPKNLEAQLRRRAKEQARQQQLERIDELRAKGVDVQTSEEREKEAEAFEDLLEKARQDAVELRRAEKAARKEAGDGPVEISDDEDEDQDYVGSGSENEDVGDADDEEELEEDGIIDEAAEEVADDDDKAAGTEDEVEAPDQIDADDDLDEQISKEVGNEAKADDDEASLQAFGGRRPRQSRIVRDEDDEDESTPEDEAFAAQPTEANDDPFAAFNFGAANQGRVLMSPTQAFNATMQTPTQDSQDDSFDMLRRIAPPSLSSLPPTLPDIDTQWDDDSQPNFIAGSQVPESQRVNLNWETQPPETPTAARLNRGPSSLSETPGWEPTQDRGLPSPWSVKPKLGRDDTFDSNMDPETQSTVELRVSESPAPSQAAPRRGRLGKRRLPAADDSEDDDEVVPPPTLKPEKMNAFREMARRRKEALTAVEKANVDREMRQMMDEQAEESEDEYAGLGGDDFVAPENDEDRGMIDSSHVEVDGRALAAHFAEKERLRFEEGANKLYTDLKTGKLRRQMAANAFDLDEDEDEIAARRRNMRQMEEAKKRRALLKDDNIASLANGKSSKGKEAFLKAIADDDGDNEAFDVVDEDSGAATQDDSTQSQSQQPAMATLQETSGNKRKHSDSQEALQERPPAKQRRTQPSGFRRPTTMMEVKESVSLLLEESHAGGTFGPSALEVNSDSEDDSGEADFDDKDDDIEMQIEQARENDGGFAPDPVSFNAQAMPPPRLPASQRRTAPKPAVVDRLSLKRGASTGSESAHGRTAWAAGPATGGFKVPSLLRRATTSTASMANNRGVTTPNLSRENSGVKMGGSKKSSLAYQARAEERKAIVEASTKRREENTARIAQMRRNSSALSRGLAGRFE